MDAKLAIIRKAKRDLLILAFCSSCLCALCLVVALWCLRTPMLWWGAALNTISLALNLQSLEKNLRLWWKWHGMERRQ